MSQGRSEAFSTGSQAQYPPQESTSYAQRPPSVMPAVRKLQATSVEVRERRSQVVPPCPSANADMAKAKGTVSPT